MVAKSSFTYVTYIRTTPAQLWDALIAPEAVKRYWRGALLKAEWKTGGAWSMAFPDGRPVDSGEVVAFVPEKRLVIRWQHEFNSALKAEGVSTWSMDLEPAGEGVRLVLTHTMDRENSKFIAAVTSAWPEVMSNLKSLLETGLVVLGPMQAPCSRVSM